MPQNNNNNNNNWEMLICYTVLRVLHYTLVWAAQALASRVFPVPGGPYIRTPFGGWMPRFSNFSLWFIGRTIASTSCTEQTSHLKTVKRGLI